MNKVNTLTYSAKGQFLHFCAQNSLISQISAFLIVKKWKQKNKNKATVQRFMEKS